MYTINIKQDNPPTDVAVATMLQEIELCKVAGTYALKIVHGYGSHGVGGLIKQEVVKALKMLRSKKQILDFIPGEKFSVNNKYYKKLSQEYPEIILDSDLNPPNFGLTIVLIKLGGFGNI